MASSQRVRESMSIAKTATMLGVVQSGTPLLRRAAERDVIEIAALINHYAALGQMLPRQEESVRQYVHEFIVAETLSKVIACGALHAWDRESAEVRSLAV